MIQLLGQREMIFKKIKSIKWAKHMTIKEYRIILKKDKIYLIEKGMIIKMITLFNQDKEINLLIMKDKDI